MIERLNLLNVNKKDEIIIETMNNTYKFNKLEENKFIVTGGVFGNKGTSIKLLGIGTDIESNRKFMELGKSLFFKHKEEIGCTSKIKKITINRKEE